MHSRGDSPLLCHRLKRVDPEQQQHPGMRNDQLVDESLNILNAVIAVLLREKLVCAVAGVSFNGWRKSTFTYCHAISMSKVGTKNEVGTEAMRSRNLVGSVCLSDVNIVSSLCTYA